jgi:hypothetical protein
LEERLARLSSQGDLSLQHQNEAQRSCEQMINQYRREIQHYEAMHPETSAKEMADEAET